MIEERLSYAELLRAAIDNAGTSRRKLSFVLAEETGNQQDSEYRAIGKYLAGEEPSRERAAILAVLLGDPQLALVTPSGDRRSARRAELEARVADLEEAAEQLSPYLKELGDRVTALEKRSQPKTRGSGSGTR